MSLAAHMKLPVMAMPQLPAGIASKLEKLKKNRGAVLLLWMAFLAGLIGADLWFTSRKAVQGPVAELAIGPIPPPLVAGRNPADRPLTPAPQDDLVIATPDGNLPTVARDGSSPRGVYAYPFDRSDARPRISVILSDVGLQPTLLEEAIKRLPGSVDLAFNAFTPALDKAVAQARADGHEVLLAVPASGTGPTEDSGPGALRADLSVAENMQRLRLLMARASGYVGLMFPLRTPVTHDEKMMQALFNEGRVRGVQMITDQPDFVALAMTEETPTAVVSIGLDDVLDPAAVDRTLLDIEQRARETGHVIVSTALYPFMIDKLADWLPTLSGKGLAIAPVSAASPLAETTAKASAPADKAPAKDHAPVHATKEH